MTVTVSGSALAPLPFQALAASVEDAWVETGNSLESFTSIAKAALDAFEYDLTLDELGTTFEDWFATATAGSGSRGPIPEQINLHNTFGEPPITVFNNGRFLVEIYYWLGCDTSIHSHGFRGAFRVLHGLSLHERFRAHVITAISSDVELCDLAEPDFEILKPGDVRRIDPDRELIHRVVHLSRPTVSLCVKTIGEKDISQWHHFSNNLAVQKRHVDQGLIKALYFAEFQTLNGAHDGRSLLERLVASSDASVLLNLCEDVAIGAFSFSEAFAQTLLDLTYERFSAEPWFQLYHAALLADEELIPVEGVSGPARLLAHFCNSRYSFAQLKAVFTMADFHVSNDDLQRMMLEFATNENTSSAEHLKRLEAFLKT